MRVLLVVGRVLLALIFIVATPRHLTAEGTVHAAELGLRSPPGSGPLAGLMVLAGGFSVASGHLVLWARLLVARLVPVTLMMHGFWRLHDAQAVRWSAAFLAPLG